MAEERSKRRLAAILAADVVGYTRLMQVDEAGTLATLKARRRDILQPILAKHNGRIIKMMGDGVLVEFSSAVDAVECAARLQEAMAAANAGQLQDHHVILRIGVNLGDVIVEGSDLYGDGVNIAARLQAMAKPGEIYVSQTVCDHVKNKVELEFEDLGEQTIKNIAEPVRLYRIAGTGPIAESATRELPLSSKPSIAVLPFDNLSGDPEQEYFADGMVEEIITALSRMRWLFVIARNSSFTYKGHAVDVKRIGHELGVRYILEGSVRKAGNRVRITGQLVEAETGRHIWADRYDRTLDDVFALQDELTMSVVAAIEPSLRQAEIERVKRKRPENLDAYDLVLRAMPHVYTAMPDGAANALPFLESALEREPNYALAHGFAAWVHQILFARGGGHEVNRLGAVRHAHAAIAYGRDDATALSLGGFALGAVARERRAACQAFESALTLSPSCALTYIFGSVVMALAGDADRGIEWGERALRLSPFDPISHVPLGAITLSRLARGEYEAAAAAAQKVFQASPYWSNAHWMLAATHAKLGRLNAAKAAAKRVLELQPGFTISGTCAAFDIHPSVAEPLSEALTLAGLPA